MLVTVTVTNSTVYENDPDGFTLPAGLTFNGIADMVAGQTVEIQPSAVSAGPVANTLSLVTTRVRLDETQVTAKVASIDTSANAAANCIHTWQRHLAAAFPRDVIDQGANHNDCAADTIPERQRGFRTRCWRHRFRRRIVVQYRDDAHTCCREGPETPAVSGSNARTHHNNFVRGTLGP